MFKYTSRKPLQATLRPGEQPARGADPLPSIQELGALLRERREAMGASLAEVETATRIRQKYLAALESDEWNLLPGEVIGRGFLRNYAIYLGLDATEVIERRRAVADPSLAGALTNVSAGAPMPPMREVDYRPKDVAIRDEPEPIEQREIRLQPMLNWVGLCVLLFFVVWGFSRYGDQVTTGVLDVASAVRTRMEPAPTATATPTVRALVANPANTGGDDTATGVAEVNETGTPMAATAVITGVEPTRRVELILIPTDTPVEVAQAITATVAETPVPTETPAPTLPPTEAATPTAGVTETPTETPTEAPTAPPAPVVAAAQCPDSQHGQITSPGFNQTVSGVVPVTGRAVHENFDRYKLEFAPGAGAAGGFTYFAGDANQVDGGVLGSFDTTSLPNGAYTLLLTVIDKTGNYPPPCPVSVIVQN